MLTTELIPAQKPIGNRLMVVLHGLGDSMEGYRFLPEALRIPWLNYLLVNAPDSYYGGFSWYDFAGQPGPGVERSRKLLFQLLDELQTKGFAANDIMLFGFSQGCLMSMEVALRYPKKLAGIVGVSGYLFEPTQLLAELSPVAREQRMLMTHGTNDPIIPMEDVRTDVAMMNEMGVRIDWKEFRKVHTIAGEIELSVIREFVLGCYPK